MSLRQVGLYFNTAKDGNHNFKICINIDVSYKMCCQITCVITSIHHNYDIMKLFLLSFEDNGMNTGCIKVFDVCICGVGSSIKATENHN